MLVFFFNTARRSVWRLIEHGANTVELIRVFSVMGNSANGGNAGKEWRSEFADPIVWERESLKQEVRSAIPKQTIPPPISSIVNDFKQFVASPNTNEKSKDVLAHKAESILLELHPGDIANIFNACKKGRYINTRLFFNLAQRVLDSNRMMLDFSSVEISMTIQSLGMLIRAHRQPPPFFPNFEDLLRVLLREALNREKSGFRKFNAQSTANVIHGLGWISRKGEGSCLKSEIVTLFDLLLSRWGSSKNMEQLRGQHLASIFHGCANSGYTNKKALYPYSNEVKRRLRDGSQTGGYSTTLFDFSCQHISMLVWSSGKLGLSTEVPFLDSLATAGVKMASQMDAQAIANLIYGFGELSYRNVELLDVLCKEIVKPGFGHRVNEQAVSNIIYGFAQLQYCNEEALDAVSSVIKRPQMLRQMRDQGFSNIVYACGKLGYRNDELLNALCNALYEQNRLQNFKEIALSITIYGLGLLGFRHENVLNALANEVSKPSRLARFVCQALANMVHGFASLQFQNRPVLDSLSTEICRAERAGLYKPQEICQILWGFGELAYKNDSVTSMLLGQLEEREFSGYRARELPHLLLSLSKQECSDESLISTVCKEIGQPHRLVELDDQNLANTAYACGKMQYFEPKFFESLVTAVQNSAEELSAQSMSNTLYGLALLKPKLPRVFVEGSIGTLIRCLGFQVVENGKLSDAGSEISAGIAWSLAELQYYSPTLMDALLDSFLVVEKGKNGVDAGDEVFMMLRACATFLHRHSGFESYFQDFLDANNGKMTSIQYVTNALWGLSALECLTPALFEKLCLKVCDLDPNLDKLNSIAARQIAQSALWVNSIHDDNEINDDNEQIGHLVQSAKRIATIGAKQEFSAFELQVQKGLLDLGIEFDCNKGVLDGLFVADVFVKGNPGAVIEVDGPIHYNVNKINGEYKEMGRTIVRNRTLRQAGYKVFCVPYFKWFSMTEEERRNWLCSELDNIIPRQT